MTAYRFLIPEDICKYDLESQAKAEDGSRSWAFDDPARVALDLIQEDLHGEISQPIPIEGKNHQPDRNRGLRTETRCEIGREYSITVSHPDWLSFYARDPKRVAWVAIYATVSNIKKSSQEATTEVTANRVFDFHHPFLTSPLCPMC